jgi:hypothetical protein
MLPYPMIRLKFWPTRLEDKERSDLSFPRPPQVAMRELPRRVPEHAKIPRTSLPSTGDDGYARDGAPFAMARHAAPGCTRSAFLM